ncbi:hypothetical protein V9O26_004721 [Escherichia coli]|nr:hypothetical protein [Escherichia coli]EFJ9809155.1 hypothetical protein [Escherichia coli]EFK2016158.1 hypothetical protein [Escherichia coli]EJY9903306.1 hypothetical protein [Escherichia coli]EJZ9814736.1 hypothetical protein [Escherichia coli]
MSGKNPFWNYDYNAAQRNREIVDSYQQANEARLNSQQAQFEASMANDEVNHLQLRLNKAIASHKKVVNGYEQQLEGFKNNFFRVALHKNILYRTISKLQEEWPDEKEFILDEMQRQRDLCNQQDYRERWWNAIKGNNLADDYLDFPFPERKVKNNV